MLDLPEYARTALLTAKPFLHGNGFMIVKLSDTERLHVWHPSLPSQKVATPIHDHTFDFRSTVLRGVLAHTAFYAYEHDEHELRWEAKYGGLYRLHMAVARDRDDTVLMPIGDGRKLHWLVPKWTQFIPTGSEYSFDAGIFHTSAMGVPGTPTVTLLQKIRTGCTPFARVAVPLGQKPDNDFNRYDPSYETLLDDVLQEVLR
jgi:hypothetical protein